MATPINILLLIATLVVSVHCKDITVRPTECVPECNPVLGGALENMTSDTTLHLMPGGKHVLTESKIIQNLLNVRLEGPSPVTVTCRDKGVGLAFINITGLTIQNITFQNCGLSGNSIAQAVDQLSANQSASMFYQVPSSVTISVVIGNCKDVTLHNVTITNTTGLGLLGINVIGASSFSNVTFSFNEYNSTENCIIEVNTPKVLSKNDGLLTGGGAFLIYYDYSPQPVDTQLTIDNCSFTGNRDCSISSYIAHFLGISYYSNALRKSGYQIGGGGGLTLVLTQLSYRVNVTTQSSTFQRNVGRYGGGAHVTVFKNVIDSSVAFKNCNFVHNGQHDNSRAPDILTNGGGLAILINCIRPLDSQHKHFSHNTKNQVRVLYSNFTENLGFIGGGIYAWSFGAADTIYGFNDQVILNYESCRFENNSAVYGAALYAYEQSLKPTWSGTKVTVSNLFAQCNSIISRDGSAIRNVQKHSGIIAIHHITITMSGVCVIAHNSETGLYAYQSAIYLIDEITFEQNIGTFGGAVCLLSYSYLIIRDNTVVNFIENRGRVKGGAFYVDYASGPDYAYRDCFLYLNSSNVFYCDDESTCDIAQLNISVNFSGNSAPGGGVVYGSTLSTCFWGQIYREKFGKETEVENFWEFLDSHSSIFHFDRIPNEIAQVTTPTATLSLKRQQTHVLHIMPGQRFNVTLVARDRFNHISSPSIAAAVMSAESLNTSSPLQTLPKVGSLDIAHSMDTSSRIPITLVGEQHQTVKLALYASYSFAYVLLEINLTNCIPGFRYNPNLTSCSTLPELHDRGIRYTIDSGKLTIPNHIWLGELKVGNFTYIVVEQCLFDYCKPLSKYLIPGDYDSQCTEGANRVGLLCASCMEGYSIVLGSRKCKMCPNNNFLTLVIVFAVAGLLLLAVVAFVKVSVSEGYLYSVLFYSHIVTQYTIHFTQSSTAVFLPTALLNLNIGVQTCFYSGMDSLARSGLQFVFPLYIYLLMGVIVLLARFFKWPGQIGFSTGKTFATLLVLSHTSILQACCDVLIFTRITTVGHKYTTFRWMVDPNVHYFSGIHAILSVIALLLMLVYIIPLPCILLFPAKAYQLRHLRKMKPIFDAFWAPFEPKFRFWLGIRLLTLSSFMALTGYMKFPHNSFILAILLVIFIFIQTQMRPYRGVFINAVDAFLLINALALLLGANYFDHLHYIQPDLYDKYSLSKTVFSAITVSTAYMVFIAVFLYHIFLRLPQKVQNCCKKRVRESKIANKFFNKLLSPEIQPDDYYLFEDRSREDSDSMSLSLQLLSGSPQFSVMDSPADNEGSIALNPTDTCEKDTY